MVSIHKHEEYDLWHAELPEKTKLLIAGRLDRIETADHFGDAKSLDNGLFELR